jgi:hypothetical protein
MAALYGWDRWPGCKAHPMPGHALAAEDDVAALLA